MPEKSIKKLTKIGQKIDEAIKAVQKIGLRKKELEEFENYINHQETILPIVDPTSYIKNSKNLDKAKIRIRLLKPIIQLKE